MLAKCKSTSMLLLPLLLLLLLSAWPFAQLELAWPQRTHRTPGCCVCGYGCCCRCCILAWKRLNRRRRVTCLETFCASAKIGQNRQQQQHQMLSCVSDRGQTLLTADCATSVKVHVAVGVMYLCRSALATWSARSSRSMRSPYLAKIKYTHTRTHTHSYPCLPAWLPAAFTLLAKTLLHATWLAAWLVFG